MAWYKIYPSEGTKEEAFAKALEKQNEQESSQLPNGVYTLSSKRKSYGQIEAKLEVKNGELILKKGSTCPPSDNKKILKLRTGALIKDDVLQKDFPCSSVSVAGTLILGYSVNGWKIWKDKSGNKIDKYRDQ